MLLLINEYKNKIFNLYLQVKNPIFTFYFNLFP